MTRTSFAPVVILALLASFAFGERAWSVDAKTTTEQAASSTGNQGDTTQPGVTQLNQGADCSEKGGVVDADKAASQGQMQASPSPCAAETAKGKPGQ